MIELSDDEKPAPSAPKAKSKALKLKGTKATKEARGKAIRSRSKPDPKNKPQDDGVNIQEVPISAPKQKSKSAPSEKDENSQSVMRAVKKAARVKRKPVGENTEMFFMGEDLSPRARNVKRLAESGAKVPTIKRRRGIKGIKNVAVQ